MLKRYSNIEFVLKQDWQFTLKMVIKASEQEVEDKLYFRWIFDNPNLQKQLTFDEYKRQLGINTEKDTNIVKKVNVKELSDKIRKFRRKVVKVEKGGLHSGF